MRHQRLPLTGGEGGRGKGDRGETAQREERGATQRTINRNLYLMSERGEQRNITARGRPATDFKEEECQHLHAQWRSSTADALLLKFGILLHKGDLSLPT